MMLAIKNKNYDLLKYFLYETIKNKYKKQLDFNNGDGDIEHDLYTGSHAPTRNQVDPSQKWKHENSLIQRNEKGEGYVHNLLYSNCKTSLNYFALAVITDQYEMATLL